MATARELFDSRSDDSWNYDHEWAVVLSANEWVIGREDAGAQIPVRYALALLADSGFLSA
jgi:hypothetical protein